MLFADSGNLAKTNKARLFISQLIDAYDLNYSDKQYELFNDEELYTAAGGTLVFDSEVYINYFLVAFRCVKTKKIVYFEDSPEAKINLPKLRWLIHHFMLVGFNSRSYDIPLLALALEGANCEALKYASNQIILDKLYIKEFEQEYEVRIPQINHVDLIEVAPLKASLKLYGGRLHARRLQELPIAHTATLTQKEAELVKFYCVNDLELTDILLEQLKPAVALRTELSKEYGQDLRSKSDAQIAEAVITSELKKVNGWFPKKPSIAPGTAYQYKVPHYIQYQLPQLQHMLEIVRNSQFVVSETGNVEMPKEVENLNIEIGKCVYRMGIGGLHSSEKCVAHRIDENTLLIDKDVASYYPSIILNQELFPKHLGKNFLRVYRDIVNRRMEAKRTAPKGVIEQSLKITINGSFGKLGNKYSALYAPDLMIQVTMTGQLALLLLIEMIEHVGIPVVSANTDGVVIKCPKERYPYLEAQVVHWQNLTGFETEETRYKAIFSRDVNNYIAVKDDGECKVKGCYAEKGSSGNSVLSKNPETLICNDAVVAFLSKGTPIEQTIRECKDIRRFVTVRQVKGGAEKSGVYLGRSVRWYYSKDAKGEINYVTNGHKVPNSDNAMPLMDLPDSLPCDIDYDHYILSATDILDDIGFHSRAKSSKPTLF